uniref:RING-CH-type domain-containing protein n=1 Tax=Oryza punctata TaxID=4537 RepID=A0A0E0JS43_ORYPU
MARTEKVAGDGCSGGGGGGGEGQVEVEVGVGMGMDGKGMIECRICQEEGEEGAMDSPCACTGTLKFAHRKCIQRWCDKKGNITCEICNQVYSPNYVLPPTKCCSAEMDMDLRQSWVGRIDPHDSHFLAIAIAEQQLLQAEFDDCVSSNSSGATCCRTVVLILMLLLLVRHVVVFVRDVSMLQDATVLFSATLQFAGFFLPCYVIARSCYTFQHRRRRQGLHLNLAGSILKTTQHRHRETRRKACEKD